MTLRRPSLLACLLSALAFGNTGCVALLDAALKESDDHGRGARHENKSYGEHYLDSLLEDDDCDCRGSCGHRSSVIVIHEDC